MSKQATKIKPIETNPQNLVAKHAFKFNKAQIFGDKKLYSRKAKHSHSESFIMLLLSRIIKAPVLMH